MYLSPRERDLLLALCEDPDGLLRTKARPGAHVNRLAQMNAIVHVATTTLSGPNSAGGTAIWRLTDLGRSLISGAGQDVNRPSGRSHN